MLSCSYRCCLPKYSLNLSSVLYYPPKKESIRLYLLALEYLTEALDTMSAADPSNSAIMLDISVGDKTWLCVTIWQPRSQFSPFVELSPHFQRESPFVNTVVTDCEMR